MPEIAIPSRVALESLDDFLELLDLSHCRQDGDTVMFDFTKCEHVCPSGVVSLVAYRDLLQLRGVQTIARINYTAIGYAALRALKVFPASVTSREVDVNGKHLRQVAGKSTELKRCTNLAETEEAVQTIVAKINDELSPTVVTLKAVDYMIGEIADNAATHGYKRYKNPPPEFPKPVYICSMAYKDRVEVAVLDRGQGIHESLRTNPDYQDVSASDALRISLHEESSGHPYGSPGFGLYSAAEMIRGNRGTLYIWSSSRRLVMDETRVKVAKGKYQQGTLVSFVVRASNPTPYDEVVGESDVGAYIDELIREA